MLVITNRNLSAKLESEGVDGEEAFGERQNAKGANEIRLAHATRAGKKWKVELVPEPAKLTPENLPSRLEFRNTIARCEEKRRDCLLYVHGFGKSFVEALEQGRRLEQRYGVEVVLFTWPTNPGGIVTKEYRDVKRTAFASSGAFDRVLERIGVYMAEPEFNRDRLVKCGVNLNLMTYSMGNFLLQNYVLSEFYGRETDMFTNVVLCQADCDNANHDSWLSKLVAGQRIYVTINEKDKVLFWSEKHNQRNRLGRTAKNLVSTNAVYVDFTGGNGVGNAHQLWGEVENEKVINFFRSALSGGRAEETAGFVYDSRRNAFQLT